MTIRIIVADDHPFILDGLDHLFRGEPDCEIVASCTNGEEALAAIDRFDPDVLVLDVRMPRMDGIELLRQLQRRPQSPGVVLLTASLDDARLLEAFRLGARGLVLKESAPRLLVQSVRQVYAGDESWNGTAIAGALRVLLEKQQASENLAARLTPREIGITRMVAQGLRNKEIASQLSITEGTVKFHLHSIYEKLQIEGRFALMTWAREHGVA